MIIVYGFFLSILASVYAENPLLKIKYMDELPEICKDDESARTFRGEELFRRMAICGSETIILKIRHPDFILMLNIPDTPVSDADCTYSKLRDLERNDRYNRSMACVLRGIIGEDPETLSNNVIRKLIKKNSKKLYATTRNSYYELNCSSEQFQNIDLREYYKKTAEGNECFVIETIKHMAFMELLHDEENDDGEDSDDVDDEQTDTYNEQTNDEQTDTDDSDVMKVIKEQMKGILKLIKSSTGRVISDDGNIIIAYTNVFEIKPSKK